MPIKKTDRKETTPTSVRITPTAQRLWESLSEHMGLSKAGVLETLLREKARTEGLYERDAEGASA